MQDRSQLIGEGDRPAAEVQEMVRNESIPAPETDLDIGWAMHSQALRGRDGREVIDARRSYSSMGMTLVTLMA